MIFTGPCITLSSAQLMTPMDKYWHEKQDLVLSSVVEKDENARINVTFFSAALHTCCSYWKVEKINAKPRGGWTTCRRHGTINVQCMVWASAPSASPSHRPAGNIPHWHRHLPRSPHSIVRILPGALLSHLHHHLTPVITHTDNTHSHLAAITYSHFWWEIKFCNHQLRVY